MTLSPIRFGTHSLSSVPRAKCLGVVFDPEISFQAQVTKTVASCFGAIRQIRSARSSLATSFLTLLMQTLVLPRLDYCISVFHDLPRFQIRRLQSVLNASARLIYRRSRFSSVTPLLHELRWLPVKARIEFRIAVLVHRCRAGLAPSYLARGLVPVSSLSCRSHLRSSSSSSLIVPFVRRSTIGQRSFPVAAAKTWNTLPSHLQQEECLTTFKRRLNAHFLSIYYD